MNIKRNDVITSGVNINPKYRYENKTGRRIFDGYSISRSIQVDIKNINQLGSIIERSVKQGINNISKPDISSQSRKIKLFKAFTH